MCFPTAIRTNVGKKKSMKKKNRQLWVCMKMHTRQEGIRSFHQPRFSITILSFDKRGKKRQEGFDVCFSSFINFIITRGIEFAFVVLILSASLQRKWGRLRADNKRTTCTGCYPAPWHPRSEERRVGKECRSRWSPY